MKNFIDKRNSIFYYFLDNILKYYIPIWYFLIAVMFYLKTYDSCQIKITIFQIGGSILILLWVLKFLEKPKESFNFYIKNWQIIIPFILFLLSGVQSHIFMSPLKKASGSELIRRIIYMISAIIVIREVNSINRLKRIINWLFLALFISTFYGIVQYIDGNFFLPNPEPGLDPFIWRQAFGKRIFSTFGNPNFYGDFLVAISPIVFAMFLYNKNPFFLILWFMSLFNTVVTYSKGAWIGFSAGIIYFAFLYIIFFSHAKIKNLIRYIILGVIFVFLVTTFAVYRQWISNTNSAKFRVYTWLSCWEMINTSPVLGTGIGTFYVTYPAWRRPQIFYIEGKHNTESDHPENEYLEVWYDEGIIGFGIFLWLIFTLIFTSLKMLKIYSSNFKILERENHKKQFFHDPKSYYLLGILSGWLASLTHNWVCVSMRFVSSGSIVWLLAGLIGSIVVNSQEISEEEKNVVNHNLVLFLICIFWFLNFLWWKMDINIVFSVILILFILSILMEYSKIKIINVEFEYKILITPFYLRIFQFLLIFFTFYLITIFRGYFIGDIHHNIAIFYSKQASWAEALTNYNIVANKNPGFIMCHYFMGNVFNDRWLLNREYHPEYGDKETDQPWSEIDLGKKGRVDPERSIAKYKDVWNLAPNYVQSHHQAGIVYLKLGTYFSNIKNQDKAFYYYKKSLELFWKYHKIDPIFPFNYYRMAFVYSQLGDLDMVEKVYKAHLFTQWLCQDIKDVLKNIDSDKDKQELISRFNEEINWYCCDYHRRQHYLLLTEDWASRRDFEYSDSYFQLANLMYYKKNYDDFEKYILRSIKRYKQNFNAWKLLIKFYQDNKKFDKLNQLIGYYRSLFPEDYQLYNITK